MSTSNQCKLLLGFALLMCAISWTASQPPTECGNRCKHCNSVNPIICEECLPEYVLVLGFCIPCEGILGPNCETCKLIQCLKCNSGFFVNSSGECSPCKKNCASCTDKQTCLQCQDGFGFDQSNNCIRRPTSQSSSTATATRTRATRTTATRTRATRTTASETTATKTTKKQTTASSVAISDKPSTKASSTSGTTTLNPGSTTAASNLNAPQLIGLIVGIAGGILMLVLVSCLCCYLCPGGTRPAPNGNQLNPYAGYPTALKPAMDPYGGYAPTMPPAQDPGFNNPYYRPRRPIMQYVPNLYARGPI